MLSLVALAQDPRRAYAQTATARSSGGSAEQSDPYHTTIARARDLARANEHADALLLFELAYRERQLPELLFELAEAHRHLGHDAASRAYYVRYLVASGEEDQAMRQRAVDGIAILDRTARLREQSRGDEPIVRVRVESAPRAGALAGGLVLFSLGYFTAFVLGLGFATTSDPTSQVAGLLLLPPILGPALSGIYFPVANHNGGLALAWTLPLLIDLAVQIAGARLAYVGAVGRTRVLVPEVDYQVGAFSVPYGGGLSFTARF